MTAGPDGLHPWTVSLVEAARRRTARSDAGDESYLRVLDAALRDVDREGDLSWFGRRAFGEHVRRTVGRRLEMVHALAATGEGEARPVAAPIVITGLYRSGTTLLHRLLATADGVRAPLFWEMRSIASRRPVSARRRTARWSRRIHRLLSPGFEDAHEIRFDDPEECFHLFEHCAPTSPFWMTAAQDYAWWLLDDERRGERVEAYRFYRRQLELLQGSDERRWILKWPFHLWSLDVLLEVFPDVTVVVCRRRFEDAVASTCSLAERGIRPFCRAVDRRRLGRFWWRLCAEGLERYDAFAAGARLAPHRLVEVDYDELCADPLAVARGLAGTIGVEPPGPSDLPLLVGRRRRHVYRSGDYGLPPSDGSSEGSSRGS